LAGCFCRLIIPALSQVDNILISFNCKKHKKYWHEEYIGKPWQASPAPPDSYNCGELLRAIYKTRFGLDIHDIDADAEKLSECIRAFRPEIFGLMELSEDEVIKEFDCVFMAKTKYPCHCGIAADTADGLMILHCLENGGVVLHRVFELASLGFSKLIWYRLKQLREI
jgi:hypothetical protein